MQLTETLIIAGRLFDSVTQRVVRNKTIVVRRGLITDVRDTTEDDLANASVDLRDAQLVLPGFVDTHVHLFLYEYATTSWTDQVTRESIAERTIRAVAHARKTLQAGFTTVRDLGTEGAGDADIALRKSLASGIIPGPRYFTANRAIVSTGTYGPKTDLYVGTDGVDGVTGAQVVDGVVECQKAVRRQIGAGADWIKLYADYRHRALTSPTSDRASKKSTPLFTREEVQTIVRTAHNAGVKVAAHVTTSAGLATLLGDDDVVDSIEHGTSFLPSDLVPLRGTDIFWSPTLAAVHTLGGPSWDSTSAAFISALAISVDNDEHQHTIRFAVGGDTCVFPHGDNALEMTLMVQLGAKPLEVLSWATLNGWLCVRDSTWGPPPPINKPKIVLEQARDRAELSFVPGDNEVAFGVIAPGFSADIIALGGATGQLEDGPNGFARAVSKENVTFVMKAGKVYKQNGVEVV